MNDTVPVGFEPGVPLTVAVNVTACPTVTAAGVRVRAAVLAAKATVTGAAAEELGPLLPSPG